MGIKNSGLFNKSRGLMFELKKLEYINSKPIAKITRYASREDSKNENDNLNKALWFLLIRAI